MKPSLLIAVKRPLMVMSMSEVESEWKRMVPIGRPFVLLETVRRGFDDREDGICTASRETEKSVAAVIGLRTSCFVSFTGCIGCGPWYARLCVVDSCCGFE